MFRTVSTASQSARVNNLLTIKKVERKSRNIYGAGGPFGKLSTLDSQEYYSIGSKR